MGAPIDTDKDFQIALAFIKSIGIPVDCVEAVPGALLSGFDIQGGRLLICPTDDFSPGDILHEAAHIAVVPAAERHHLFTETLETRPQFQAEEMMSIAWSFAACMHLNIAPEFVFHDKGYKGEGAHIAQSFKDGRYVGVPMLAYADMCVAWPPYGLGGTGPAYPAMVKWMRD